MFENFDFDVIARSWQTLIFQGLAFTAQVTLSPGTHELWSRATDSEGNAQPEEARGWNPQGYCANPVHKIEVTVG